jgi:hypothetical protein
MLKTSYLGSAVLDFGLYVTVRLAAMTGYCEYGDEPSGTMSVENFTTI